MIYLNIMLEAESGDYKKICDKIHNILTGKPEYMNSSVLLREEYEKDTIILNMDTDNLKTLDILEWTQRAARAFIEEINIVGGEDKCQS